MQEELPSEASVGGDASAHRILLETDDGELTEAGHAALLLSSRDLATYQGQFKYYVPSKSDVAAPDITEVRVLAKRVPYLAFRNKGASLFLVPKRTPSSFWLRASGACCFDSCVADWDGTMMDHRSMV